MHEHFAVGARAKDVAALVQPELAAQLLKVVHLAVVDHLDRAVLVAHGLPPGAAQIDDGQATMAQRDAVVVPGAAVVGAAMRLHVGHAVDQPVPWAADRWRSSHDAANSAHGSSAQKA